MSHSVALNAFKSSAIISWKSTGNLQKTISKCVEISGIGLHSGKQSKVQLCPELAGKGRYFRVGSSVIPASIDFVRDSPLCTQLFKDGFMVRTVEHLLSALEGTGVDNCRIEIIPDDLNDRDIEIPILDGSAMEWVDAIYRAGLDDAFDEKGRTCEKLAAFLNVPVSVQRNDSFLAAFPSSEVLITYGINFPEVPSIGCQWLSCTLSKSHYAQDIAKSRTFCVYEEVERMREMGLIKGGSLNNAIVCRYAS
ncbi:hypothetical protein RND81_02G182200 [Saponaria officinalis]|uniref:UDP-3-O-acyl-N-acetylglucosamine deacetylase n=1 Tax=Saponaria officinalis TaxID=3572 RepID=A0AAW1MVS4_SAPOF